MSKIDEAIRKYAADLDQIYRDRTAGDYTFTGVLAMFAHELLGERSESTEIFDNDDGESFTVYAVRFPDGFEMSSGSHLSHFTVNKDEATAEAAAGGAYGRGTVTEFTVTR